MTGRLFTLALAAACTAGPAFLPANAIAQGRPSAVERDAFERGYRAGREDERLLGERYQYDRAGDDRTTRERQGSAPRSLPRRNGYADYYHPGLWGQRPPERPPVDRWIGRDGRLD